MELKILDCTLRDGGLVNRFYFSDEFVRGLYRANLQAGIDYMEFGYKASETLFDRSEFGKWKFCREEAIRAIVGENKTSMKISVMADVGRTDYKRDIIAKKDSVIDLIRVAAYADAMDEAMEMLGYCHELGYETAINIMAVSNNTEEEIRNVLERVKKSPADAVYLVDSYGSFYPEQIGRLMKCYMDTAQVKPVETGRKPGKPEGRRVGIHAHNNQQLAFANTIEAMRSGASLLDVTVNGMGRGAGNCSTEQLLGYLSRTGSYNELPIIEFIEKEVIPLKKAGILWGYDIPYLLTGQNNRHPSQAIEFVENHKDGYAGLLRQMIGA